MKRRRKCSAFSQIEMVVILLVVGLLAGVSYSYIIKARRQASKFTCTQNLKLICLFGKSYAADHNGNFPWMLPPALGGSLEYSELGGHMFRYFQVQSNYIQMLGLILCPQDTRQVATDWEYLANKNVSYFIGLDSRPNSPMCIVSGDRNITSISDVTILASQHALPSWIKSVGLHGDTGHISFGDGHVEELNSDKLTKAIQDSGVVTNHFAVP